MASNTTNTFKEENDKNDAESIHDNNGMNVNETLNETDDMNNDENDLFDDGNEKNDTESTNDNYGMSLNETSSETGDLRESNNENDDDDEHAGVEQDLPSQNITNDYEYENHANASDYTDNYGDLDNTLDPESEIHKNTLDPGKI